MAESGDREIVWTNSALADLRSIYQFNISLLGEEKAFKRVELIKIKAEVLHQPIIGSSRFISKRYPERNYQKLVIKPYILVFRQIGQVVFINRVFDSRQNPDKLDL